MKRIFLLAGALVAFAGVYAQQKKVEDVIKFKEVTYDFGKIKQGVPVSHDFVFTNIGDAPVVIESATPSCGCTTPVKPEGAIPKGKTDKITAAYNAAALGPVNKTITIKVAGIDVPLQLRIVGEVLTADAFTKYEAEKSGKTSKAGS